MQINKDLFWTYYMDDDVELDPLKVGKWMLFFNFNEQRTFFDKICEDVVIKKILQQTKCSSRPNPQGQGVAIFYLHIDDKNTHKKIITYFIENNLIKETKAGKFYNLSFKLDNQTRAGEYGDDFKAQLKLEEIINLSTGEFQI